MSRLVGSTARGLCTLGLAAALWIPGAAAEDASAWAVGYRSRARLVAGGPDLAGIEIALDPGFKTYWRNPGESGLPPAFDWSKSSNLESLEILWPAPRRQTDAAGVTFTYPDHVLLPVRVTARDAARPVTLDLKLDYGACKDICIPAEANLLLELPRADSSRREAIEAALARVPAVLPPGAPGDLAVLDLTPVEDGPGSRLEARVRVPPGQEPELFVEAPEPWFLLAEAHPVQGGSGPGQDEARFVVEVLDAATHPAGPLAVRLTLVAGARAVETTMTLDAARLAR